MITCPKCGYLFMGCSTPGNWMVECPRCKCDMALTFSRNMEVNIYVVHEKGWPFTTQGPS